MIVNSSDKAHFENGVLSIRQQPYRPVAAEAHVEYKVTQCPDVIALAINTSNSSAWRVLRRLTSPFTTTVSDIKSGYIDVEVFEEYINRISIISMSPRVSESS